MFPFLWCDRGRRAEEEGRIAVSIQWHSVSECLSTAVTDQRKIMLFLVPLPGRRKKKAVVVKIEVN